MSTDLDDQPTYGGWRKTRGFGWAGMGEAATVVCAVTILVGFVVASTSIEAFFTVYAPIAVVIIGASVIRWQGETLGMKIKRRIRFWWGTKSRFILFNVNGVMRRTGGTALPSLLAPTKIVPVHDGRGGLFGLVWDQRTGFMTATFKCDSLSTWLVDARQANVWVANWHSWLADLGIIPLVRWVAVTVETAPEPGSALAEHVKWRKDPRAPQDCQELLDELVRCLPEASADVETRVSITFDPSRSFNRLKGLDEQAAEINRILVGMESALGECGVAVLGRATPAELAGVLRNAYDPVNRGHVKRVLAGAADRAEQLLQWNNAGPLQAEESWEAYRHDSGVSATWAWQEAPRQQVLSNVLIPLMGPSSWPKRITLLYRPLSAEQAAQALEREVQLATMREGVRVKTGRDETARDRADRERADAAAREEALGAGVVNLSIYATVTVTDEADLEAAKADMESRGNRAKVRLRPMFGSQAAGFVVTLPAGVHPAHAAGRGRR